MAGPRQVMTLMDGRRDRVGRLQLHQGPLAAAVPAGSVAFQNLQHHFPLAQQRFEGLEEEEVSRMAGNGGLWNAAHEQQRVLAADALRQRRVNTIQPLPTLANSLIHQGPGPGGQPPDWDGVGLVRHIESLSSGRPDRNFLADEQVRLRQQSVANFPRGGEFPRGISREVYSGLRHRESRDEILNNELKSAIGRNLIDEAREISRAYQRSTAVAQQKQLLEPLSRNRGLRFGLEENGHAELIARYGDRSSSRNLERAHAAIGPAYHSENLSRKRNREEEADLDRERLVRHRKLSGIDNSPPFPLPVRSPASFHSKAHGQKERNQEVRKAKHWHLRSEEDEHEDGQITPSPPKKIHKVQQHGTESKTQLLKQEKDVMIVASRTEGAPKGNDGGPRYQSASAFPSVFEFHPNSGPHSSSSRSPKARTAGISVADQFKALGRSREPSVPTRERLPSPRYENNERTTPRLELVDAGFVSKSNDLLDIRSKERMRESQNDTTSLNSKSAGRLHDGPHRKRQLQAQDSLGRDSKSLSSRNKRLGGAESDSLLLLDRFRKESGGRTETFAKRKISNPAKDSRLVGEMTISVQKHGQRIVKVEEYKPRETQSRVASQTIKDYRLSQREGSLRDVHDSPFTSRSVRDRLGVIKRKEYEGRPPAAAQERSSRPHSSKVGITHQQYLEKPTSQERFLPYSHFVKDELVGPTEKYELEPSRQHQSIFTRLAGFRPETSPTSPRTPAQTKRKESSLLSVHDNPSLPSSSTKSPTVLIQTSARKTFQNDTDEFPGFPMPTRSSRSSDFSREFVDTGLVNSSKRNPAAEWALGRQAEPYERPYKATQKGQAQDISTRNESVNKAQLESAVSRLSHYSQKVFSPLEQGVEGLKELRLPEGSVIKNPDQSKPRQAGAALQSGDSVGTSRPFVSDMGAAEGCDQLPGSGSKALPKVIATGHKKDQILKNNSLSDEQVVQMSSPPPVEAVTPVENSNQERCEGRISSSSLKGEWFERTSSPADCEHASPQSDSGDKKLMNVGNVPQVVSTVTQSVRRGSTPTGSCSPIRIQPSKASWDAGELEQSNPSPVLEIPLCLQTVAEGGSRTVVSDLHVDGESESGLSITPLSSPALSTPKEVRLFGANLNASIGERVDLTPKVLEAVDQYVIDSCTLPAENHDQVSVSVEKIPDSSAVIQSSEEDVSLQVVQQTEDEQLSPLDKPSQAEQSVLICNDKDLKLIAHDLPLVQVELKQSPPIPQERHLPVPLPPKATAAPATHGGQLSSSHPTGAHIWRRGSSSIPTPASNANVFRATRAFGEVIQSAGLSSNAQSSAYVRKGNSLVRAPGPATLRSGNDIKAISVNSGQAKPLATKLPMTKPVPFRNTFISNSTTSKPYFSISRKYVAPFVESDGALVSSVRPVTSSKISSNSNELGMSQLSQSDVMKSPPQAVLQALGPPLDSSTLLVSHQEHQLRVMSSPETSVLDTTDDQKGEAGVYRPVKDTTPSSQSTDVTSVPGNLSTRVLENPGIANRLYVRRKANQLVVAPAQHANVLSVDAESIHAKRFMRGHYYKRKTNQLVRSMSGKGISSRNVTWDPLDSRLSPSITDEQGGGRTLVSKKMRRGRALRQKKGSSGRSSWVWTLSGAAVGHANNFYVENRRTGPLLFPWKRQNSLRSPGRSQKLRPLPEGEKGSLLFLMSKSLRKVRPVQPVYTRSADGFSLRRSGVMSLGGGNLKWTKSLEKCAKQASEVVTKVVAEAERRKREKKEAVAKAKAERRATRRATRGEGERIVWVGLVRYKMDAASKTLQRVPDSQAEAGDADTTSPTGWAKTSPLLTPRRSIIGGTVYLRVGNGNQLVRDPKAASRALASEKVRWSLHNARSRGAKKQQYCQFFTRFGKCNRKSGKCPYIHDPEKVVVCTKFLKGNCMNDQCLLTHKVIPERMPDCSFFLEGLCTNENCPYRHVNVNPKASYCDGFLRGYCKDGDKCNQKHTYVCSVYAETGECPDRATCKFHHPKKKDKPPTPVNGHKIGAKRKRRYFSTVDPQSVRQKIDSTYNEESSIGAENGDSPGGGSMDFISLSNIESDEDQIVMSSSRLWPEPEPGVAFTMQKAGFADEIEKWIKPTFLLEMTSSTAAAH